MTYILIDDQVIGYLNKKNSKVLTLRLRQGHGWCQGVGLPQVEFKVPVALDGYDKYDKDAIDVYIDKNIQTVSGLIHFKLDKMMMFEKVIVHGLDLDFDRK